MSMLSNIAFVLEDVFSFSAFHASLIIGSIPGTMIVASGLVALAGGKKNPPMRLLRYGMVGLAAAAALCVCVGVLPRLEHQWPPVMVSFYLMVLFQSMIIPPIMTLYMQPWKDDAGTASGVIALVRSVGSALLAMGSTSTMGRFQVPGLMVYIGGLLSLPQLIFWTQFGCSDPDALAGPPGSSDNYQTLPGQDPSDDGAGGGGTDDP